ncbi:MAG: N-acetylmuramoyl-L-alanine amidase [Sandaracinaceae bacterium]|nr:N-acetylmuramoyl-L-alanine amidase [Sandaracinaceae bacterium]
MKEVEIIDLSAEQPRKARPVNGKFHHKRDAKDFIIQRNPLDVRGITIHQTACVFGPANDPVKKHRRALNIAAHVTAFRDGTVVQGHELRSYVWHGNGLNAFTLGLECEGVYDGVRIGKPEHPREQIDDVALASFQAGLKLLVDKGRADGMPIEYIWAHRQSHPKKPADPGWEIWQKVVIEFGINALGLKACRGDTFGGGRPIPKQWDSKSTAPYA